ncbi:TetR/AcrR family transcriptional regulator [Kiloniella sp.]|uniref:TetR/AcrR family transcriptional regulator n=1 Tax=Kiloniella sp. TaxID=1938587 RepID=UPI003B01E65C
MARPREFDLDFALEQAMNVFWEKGYEGAGLNELLSAMHIARGSLYKAFGDKRALFLATLAHYDKTCIGESLDLLSNKSVADGAERIVKLMENIALAVEVHGDRRGCFLCNSVVDQAPHDKEIESLCQRMMGRMERGFVIALKASKKAETVTQERLIENARNLNVTYNGLRVMAKAGYSADDIRRAIDTALQEIGIG